MGEVDRDFLHIRALQLKVEELESSMYDNLRPGGGGGTSGGMETRVARLENQVDRLSDRVGEVAERLATLNERVGHLPSKSYIDTRLLALLALIAALITFGEKLQALIR